MDGVSSGEILRALRGDKKLEEVALAAGVGVSSITMYEHNQRTPRDEVKKRLANFYGKTVQEIFFPEDGHLKHTERS